MDEANLRGVDWIKKNHRKIVEQFVDRLPLKAVGVGLKDWTLAVKATMHELCREHLGSCGKEFWGTYKCKDEGQHSEWLLDVVWYRHTDRVEAILLGLESEWTDSTNEVCSDFTKVLSVKAPLKIMVFEAGSGRSRNGDKQIRGLESVCKNWCQHSTGDLIYAINFHDGRHDVYFAQASRSGQISNFKFDLIADLSGNDRSES